MSERIKDLYKKYIENDLSPEDLQTFREQMADVSDDRLWELMQKNTPREISARMDASTRQSIHDRIHKTVRREMWWHKAWKYAAAAIVLLVSASQIYLLVKPSAQDGGERMASIVVKPGNKADIVLPDGTRVNMNSGTELNYRIRAGEYREVYIRSGEAYFDVAKDTRCRFRVFAGDIEIKVLGTAFNVKTYDDKIETSLFRGSIKLQTDPQQKDYALMPGQKLIYDETTRHISIEPNDAEVDAGWKNGYLIFNSSPLHEVLKQIERWYGVTILLENKKYIDDLLTGSYRNEKLEKVLNSLSLQYKFNYRMKNDTIVIE